ncbi:MAG: aldo/keto reductase [bacterium]|nr:aldo/keto reductase [bacterium]
MIIPTKKLKNGFEIAVYGLGTWRMGGGLNRDEGNNDEVDIEAIKTAIELGVTHFDTAEVYAGGFAEILLGKAIAGNDRSKLFLSSKVDTQKHAKYDDVIAACKKSLKRLNTPYLDLYLTHRRNPSDVSYKETMKAMDALVEEGLVKNIGFCNYRVSDIQEAQSYAKYKLVAGQMHYNLQIREIERKRILNYCQKNDIMLVAWRPIQKGALLNSPQKIMQKMMGKYGKTAAQIAINWLISQEKVVVLSKTSSVQHLKDNLGAIGWSMEKEDVEKLRKEYPDRQDISDSVPLV